MSRPDASPYVHGTHAQEQARLADLNALVNEHSLAAIAPCPGERLLDVGAGLGQFARAFARAAAAPAVAVERSAEQLARAVSLAAREGEADRVDFRAGDARALPLAPHEWGAFDVAHARFLLEHVADPAVVVAEMARAVRPGGRVVLEDDDHEALALWPEPPHVATVWRAYQRTYDRHGQDPIVGRRLVELMAGAGLRPCRIASLPFGACSGQREFRPLVENMAEILRGARAPVLETGGCSVETFEGALAALEAFASRGDAALWYVIRWAEGTRP